MQLIQHVAQSNPAGQLYLVQHVQALMSSMILSIGVVSSPTLLCALD